MMNETSRVPEQMPRPCQDWRIAMKWHDLLFMHWPVKAEQLRPYIPARLEIDQYDGTAWIGIVPFRMTGIRHRFTPALPCISAFPEINVRTYVTLAGEGHPPAVWFLSLDAGSPLAVRIARWSYCLLYHDAKMTIQRDDREGLIYRSDRLSAGTEPATFAARYGPAGGVYSTEPGNLDHWLTERYSLYSADQRGDLYRGDVWHECWPLQPAWAAVEINRMTHPLGIALPERAPVLHFARRVDAVVRWLIRV